MVKQNCFEISGKERKAKKKERKVFVKSLYQFLCLHFPVTEIRYVHQTTFKEREMQCFQGLYDGCKVAGDLNYENLLFVHI